jgi:predicted ribosome quality control (RQC) complex YloA/Tae2 family protein
VDNLVLTRIAAEWERTLVGARLRSFTQESATRFRLVFAPVGEPLAIVVSLDPDRPWMGPSVRRWVGPVWEPAAWLAASARESVGRSLERLTKAPADRTVLFELGDGRGVAVELTPHKSNLVVLGKGRTIEGRFRRYRDSEARLAEGAVWSPPPRPAGKLDPFEIDAAAIDADLSRPDGDEPIDPASLIGKRFYGVSREGAGLAAEEHRATGEPLGSILQRHLEAIRRGQSEVVIEGRDGGPITPEHRLLPWRPVAPPGRALFVHGGAAETSAWFHEGRDEHLRVAARIEALGSILRRELGRTAGAAERVQAEIKSFEDPDRYRKMGEALLAGLNRARWSGGVLLVPDPYDPAGDDVEIPAAPGKSLTTIADQLFGRQRRSRRGLATARVRLATLAERSRRLGVLLAAHERVSAGEGAERLEEEMRSIGLPVGLTRPGRKSRAASATSPPRLAGVRMVVSADGWTILVGRTGPDNDRLTFKMAAPDDVWLHAAGVPGAHVVIRNPDRAPRLPDATLIEAASLALWFSDGRDQGVGDVNWTRRKYVRRVKGAASGKVALKRFETIRVRARKPPDEP